MDVVRCSVLDLHVRMVVISRFQTVVALGALFRKLCGLEAGVEGERQLGGLK